MALPIYNFVASEERTIIKIFSHAWREVGSNKDAIYLYTTVEYGNSKIVRDCCLIRK